MYTSIFFLIPTILCNIVLCNFVNLFCRNHVRRRICIFQFSQRFCWFYFLKNKPMCFSRPTKDLVYTLHLTIRGSILSTYIFQNHDVIFDDESHFKINKKRKEFEFESTNIILFLISTQELLKR